MGAFSTAVPPDRKRAGFASSFLDEAITASVAVNHT
jgi:hypothetical protein